MLSGDSEGGYNGLAGRGVARGFTDSVCGGLNTAALLGAADSDTGANNTAVYARKRGGGGGENTPYSALAPYRRRHGMDELVTRVLEERGVLRWAS